VSALTRDSESPIVCADEIIDLINWTKSAVLSILIARSDDDQLANQVKEVNSTLKKFCRQNQWKMIAHFNIIAEQHLNRSGLHLDKIAT